MFKRALTITMLVLIAVALAGPGLLPALIRAQGAVTVTPNRDYVNVRLWPAIGATVIGSLEPGDVMTATGRSVDNDWVRIDFLGSEGWVGLLVVDVTGSLAGLPLADPRTIPYNSNVVPGAGGGNLAGPLTARLEDSGVALRAGPSTAYPILQNLPRYAEVSVTGRVASNRWVQVSWEGLIGWAVTSAFTFQSPGDIVVNDLPVVPPAADIGVRLSDANARDRFLVVDEIRRHLDRARATLDVIAPAWTALRAGHWPEVCSAPPVMDTYWLGSVERNAYPDLIEAVAVLNQGINDLNNAVQWWLEACNGHPDNIPGVAIAGGPSALERARTAFDDVLIRITSSRAVQIMAIHAHINYAQDQFERIEAIWLDVRFGVSGIPPCVNTPEQPPDYALTAWEQATFPDLVPLVARLNEGLVVLRRSIQIWEDECDQFNANPSYLMPVEAGTEGYNTMLQARQIMNEVRDVELTGAYGQPGFIVPAATSTPDATVAAILHAPYTPTFTPSPTPVPIYAGEATVARSSLHPACAWFGIAGEVFNADGSPRLATHIHVFGPGLDVHTISGRATRYGESGWEVPLRVDAAQNNTWRARIEDAYGNPLSPEMRIDFTDGCELNVALVTFTLLE